jgi:hypothetical protein
MFHSKLLQPAQRFVTGALGLLILKMVPQPPKIDHVPVAAAPGLFAHRVDDVLPQTNTVSAA